MKSSRLALGLSAALLIGTLAATTTQLTAARDDDEGRLYLALGDSGPFGYITQAGFEYANPQNFVGYPAYVAQALRLDPVNASCPGETTGSFLSSTAADNGCRAFRARAPLHVQYTGTQLAFATAFLTGHRNTRLVTLTLGANDLFLLEAGCRGDVTCVLAALPQALGTITFNVETILAGLRATGFDGPILVSNYYATDYTDLTRTGVTAALNQALATAAAAQGALVGDTFTAFRTAASNPFAAGNPCRAGLLNALPANQFLCDIHPSQSGHRLIADTITRLRRIGHETE
jgi:lysophospholipase L1-like esterase